MAGAASDRDMATAQASVFNAFMNALLRGLTGQLPLIAEPRRPRKGARMVRCKNLG